jgi:drug/metabolite transporter (DMT)-like permease
MVFPSFGDLAKPHRLRGIVCVLVATFLLTVMNAMVRHVSEGLHVFEIVFFRNLFGLIVILPWFVRYGFAILRTRRHDLHLLRGVLQSGSMLTFFYALTVTPLTDVTALFFVTPIFGAIFAVIFLKEQVGARRWAAILFGFAGTSVVLKPGSGPIDLGAWLTIASALLWALTAMVIKVVGREDSSVTITAYMTLLLIPFTLVPALFVWTWPTAGQFAWLVAIGVIATVGHLLMAQAFKDADTHVVLPLDFFRLVWMTGIAYVWFAEVPSPYTWVGGVMIGISATYITHRERVLHRRATQALSLPPSAT